MMNSQEIETAVRLQLDLVIVVIRDDAYGMIKWKQSGMQMPAFGMDFQNPDFVAYAESFGAFGYRIAETGQLGAELQKCLLQPGVHLIEVPIDYSENIRVFFEELKKKTCKL
jgi:acetolactate synthase-1/2/3 large subunit